MGTVSDAQAVVLLVESGVASQSVPLGIMRQAGVLADHLQRAGGGRAEPGRRDYAVILIDSTLLSGEGMGLLAELRTANPASIFGLMLDAQQHARLPSAVNDLGVAFILDKPLRAPEVVARVRWALDEHGQQLSRRAETVTNQIYAVNERLQRAMQDGLESLDDPNWSRPEHQRQLTSLLQAHVAGLAQLAAVRARQRHLAAIAGRCREAEARMLASELAAKVIPLRVAANEDARVHPRAPLAGPVRYFVHGAAKEAPAENVSTGGLFIAATEPLPVGQELDVEFALPEHPRPIRARAQVAWVRPGADARQGQGTGFGVRFVHIADDAREAIDHYVDSWHLDGFEQLDRIG